jgi:hypothetical protein
MLQVSMTLPADPSFPYSISAETFVSRIFNSNWVCNWDNPINSRICPEICPEVDQDLFLLEEEKVSLISLIRMKQTIDICFHSSDRPPRPPQSTRNQERPRSRERNFERTRDRTDRTDRDRDRERRFQDKGENDKYDGVIAIVIVVQIGEEVVHRLIGDLSHPEEEEIGRDHPGEREDITLGESNLIVANFNHWWLLL